MCCLKAVWTTAVSSSVLSKGSVGNYCIQLTKVYYDSKEKTKLLKTKDILLSLTHTLSPDDLTLQDDYVMFFPSNHVPVAIISFDDLVVDDMLYDE